MNKRVIKKTHNSILPVVASLETIESIADLDDHFFSFSPISKSSIRTRIKTSVRSETRGTRGKVKR